ncbi:MAG: 16S rRNA (cytosine(1402)-N(4))-methyltransferase RsmH [Acidimicrobiales bacterium]
MTRFEHRPVMVDRIVELLGPVPPGVAVDATVGGGGHARAILAAHEHLRVVGIDQDDEALAAATEALAAFGDRVSLHHVRFDRLPDVLEELEHDGVSAVLFDLGVSSPQFDRRERGFSYRQDAPLDMRMDRRGSRTAADVVNSYTEAELEAVLRRYGDERYARRIARAIVNARPVETTGELAEAIGTAIPAPARRRRGHPARRTFQAIRIEVNEEIAILAPSVDAAIDVLVPGGRCAVLAYHSGEDRIVKERFREAATGGCTCPPGLPCQCGATPKVRLLRPGTWKPSSDEVAANPRAGSARLRAVERLPHEEGGVT